MGSAGRRRRDLPPRQAEWDLLAEYGADTCNGLVLVPFGRQLDDSDLTAEDYNAEGLLNYPVLPMWAALPSMPGRAPTA